MTDDQLLDAMHLAYHLAWGAADRRRNVTRQVMAPLLALVREHDDRDRGQGERDLALRYTSMCEANVKLQAQLESARREAHEAGLREGKVEGLREAKNAVMDWMIGKANDTPLIRVADETWRAIQRLIYAAQDNLSAPPEPAEPPPFGDPLEIRPVPGLGTATAEELRIASERLSPTPRMPEQPEPPPATPGDTSETHRWIPTSRIAALTAENATLRAQLGEAREEIEEILERVELRTARATKLRAFLDRTKDGKL
ncbi:MAG TPA: hypothetical protein VMS92_22945 [Mycobacterium sp.]|nr:hypothetical protein [Mycobacterium sp.]